MYEERKYENDFSLATALSVKNTTQPQSKTYNTGSDFQTSTMSQ